MKNILNAESIAGAIVQKCLPLEIEDTTQMKLQKLVYFAWVWHGALFGKKLFDELPEAWEHGAVFPSLRKATKSFEKNPIFTEDLRRGCDDLDKKTDNFLNGIVEHYGKKSASELRELSHNQLWSICHKTESQKIAFEKAVRFYKKNLVETTKIEYDKNYKTWVATSPIILGLVLEGENYDSLLTEIQNAGEELIELNCS
jgi:uncharacterized phage-associated protein